jgi:hypothetical protein
VLLRPGVSSPKKKKKKKRKLFESVVRVLATSVIYVFPFSLHTAWNEKLGITEIKDQSFLN